MYLLGHKVIKNSYRILLNNFDKSSYSNYCKAIETYNDMIPEEDRYILVIAEASNKYSDYGLWYSKRPISGKDASLFWDIYRRIKETS